MITVDTSALIAVVKQEPAANSCASVIQRERQILISAATLTEALIVAARQGFTQDMERLLKSAVTRIVDVTPVRAQLAAEAYTKWGKNFHAASLNFGDCFSYATAKEFSCPLLYIGNDFAQTDIPSAIAP